MQLKKLSVTVITLLSFLAISNPVYSQETPASSPPSTLPDARFDSVTFVSGGVQALNLYNLNQALGPGKYPDFNSTLISISTGGRTTSNTSKIVTGSEASFTMQSKNLNIGNGYKSFFSSSASIIGNIGYLVYSTENIKLYPTIGAGIGRTYVDLYKDETTPSFKDILTKPERGSSLSSINILLDLAVATDYLIKIGKSKEKKGGVVFGFKAGYLFTVYSTGLQLSGETVAGSPSINNNGPYIRIFAGYTDDIISALLDMF